VRTDWISFLTDYGTYDGFVAACHGVIGGIAPTARVIDITHDVPPGDIRRGAVVLAQTAPYLPPAVHVAVVDPGVGTARQAVALQTPGGLLVGPDNGLLGWAADALGGVERAVRLDNAAFHLSEVTATFHGRDIFAPVGAHLAAGAEFAELGAAVDPGELVRLRRPVLAVAPGSIGCEVLTVDRFGNVQTSADPAAVAAAGLRVGEQVEVLTGGATREQSLDDDPTRHEVVFGGTFGTVERDQLLSYMDSAGLLSVAVNGGNAASRLHLQAGDPVEFRTFSRQGAR
jgi:hypothetical protein